QEMRNLPVNIAGIIDGVGDYLAKQRHVTLADALDAGAHAALGYLPSHGETGVFAWWRVLEEQSAQGVEPVGLAGLLEFDAQPFHDRVENRLGPAAIEGQFGRRFRCRLMAVACLGVDGVERDFVYLATALLARAFLPFIGEEMLDRGEQERTEAALVAVYVLQIMLREEQLEESLRQILGVMRAVALAADECVERIPVGTA